MRTLVTKWPLRKLPAHVRGTYAVYGVGNEAAERTTVDAKTRAIDILLEADVPVLPTFHPYIPGVTRFDILPHLRARGLRFVDVKGFRWDAGMRGIPRHPELDPNQEVLVEDGWRHVIHDAGLSLRSPREWYASLLRSDMPRVSLVEAQAHWQEIKRMAVLASSDVEGVEGAYLWRKTRRAPIGAGGML